jgi:glutaredoxin 3
MSKKIRIYSTPTCTYCVILKRYLDGKNVEYENLDVSQDEEAQKEMIAKTNQMGVPVIDIDGEIIIGFDKEKIDNILNL